MHVVGYASTSRIASAGRSTIDEKTRQLPELKHRQHRMAQLKTWVFAIANNVDKLLAPLLTRFTVIHLKPYTFEEFVEIAVRVLSREGVSK